MADCIIIIDLSTFRKGDLAMLSTLLETGGDANALAQYQMTPLHIAAWHGHKDAVIHLAQAGKCFRRQSI